MKTRYYAAALGELKRLVVTHGWGFKNLSIEFDGHLVMAEADPEKLKTPHTVPLPDGRKLTVYSKMNWPVLRRELYLEVDGKAVFGSTGHSWSRVKEAYQILYFIAAVHLVIGLFVVWLQSSSIRSVVVEWGPSWFYFLMGIVFGLLGFFVKARQTLALGFALVAWGLNVLLTVFVPFFAQEVQFESPTVYFLRIYLFMGLLQGFFALRRLNREEPI